MSPKAKLGRSGNRHAEASSSDAVDLPASADEPEAADLTDTTFADKKGDPSPFDSAEFLEANRRNREKMRAAAQARRAKEAARARRRAGRWWNRSGSAAATTGEGRASSSSPPSAASDDPDTTQPTAADAGGWTVPVLSALLVLALIAAGVLAYLFHDADDRAETADEANRLRPGAVETAGTYATDLLTYDSANFAALDARIAEIATPAFAKDFIEGSRQAREGSANAQAVAKAEVVSAGVVSLSSTKAVVLLAINQNVTSPDTNGQLPEGIPYQSRVEVTLVRVGDDWKLDDLVVI
jgi:Mce-associated membrane protein